MRNLWNLVKRSLSTVEVPHVIEVGAHIGTDTTKIMDIIGNREYRYTCFEPDPMNYHELDRLVQEKNWSVVVSPRAVADFNGVAKFHCSRGKKDGVRREITDLGSLRAPINPTKIHRWVTFNRIDVSVVRLDTYLRSRGWDRVDFLWADIQGGELDLLNGLGDMLDRVGAIYLEYSTRILYSGQPTLEDIRAKLVNFKLLDMDKFNAFFIRNYG